MKINFTLSGYMDCVVIRLRIIFLLVYQCEVTSDPHCYKLTDTLVTVKQKYNICRNVRTTKPHDLSF